MNHVEPQLLDAVSAAFIKQDHPVVSMWVFGPNDAAPPPSYEEFFALVDSRLHLTPFLRTTAHPVPLPMSRPVWVEDPEFELSRHVLERPAPDPCGAAELARLAWELMREPWDYRHPLWRFYFIKPAAGGALVIATAQHAFIDGAGALRTIAALTLSVEPGRDIDAPLPWNPTRYTDRALVKHALRNHKAAAARAARLLRHPRRAGSVLDAAVAIGEMARLARELEPVPAMSTRPGDRAPDREELSLWSNPQTDVKLLSRQLGVTVNVVMLAALSGAVRRWALDNGRDPEDYPVLLPVALPRSGDARNSLASTLVRLACNVPDPLQRLRILDERQTEALKKERLAAVIRLLTAVALAPPGLRRPLRQWLESVGGYDFTISNIPGPPISVWMLGCPLTHLYCTGALRGPDCAKMTVASCAENITATLLSDVDQVGPANHLVQGLDHSLQELIDLGSRLSLLRSQRVLMALRDSAHDRLATSMRPLSVAAGEAIVDEREREQDPSFFLLAKGRCEVMVGGNPTRHLNAPASFGEIAALRRVPRTASVRALTDCALYAIDGSMLREIINQDFTAQRMAAEVMTLREAGEEPAPLSR